MTLLDATTAPPPADANRPASDDIGLGPIRLPPNATAMTEAELVAHLEAALAAELAAEATRQPAVPAPAAKGGQRLPEPSQAPSPAPVGLTRRGTPRIRKREIKWRHAAVMIARGVGITEVSYEYGVCESQILRNLRRSARFRQWIREAEAAVEADAARHAAWLRLRAASSLADRAESRDPKTLEQLARPIADLARSRIGEAAETRPEMAYARLSGFSKKDFR
jgi:hypothetical protein